MAENTLAAVLMNTLGAILLTLLLIALLAVVVRFARWAVRDARRRGKSPLLVCIAVLLFFPWGLFAWLLFRPAPAIRPPVFVR